MKKQFLFLLTMLVPVFAWAQAFDNDNVRIQSFTYQGDDTQSKIVVEYNDGSKWNALTTADYDIEFHAAEDDALVTTVRNQGDYYAVVSGKGSYSGSADKVKFTVKRAGLTVNLLNASRFYGQDEDETEAIIQINGYKAGDDEDTAPVTMTVISSECRNAGGVKGFYKIDDATGVADNYDVGVDIQSTAKLEIKAKNIEGLWVVSNDASVEYNGNPQEPAVEVTDENGDVVDPSNYDVVYPDPAAIDVKTGYVITVTAKGNYTGEETSTFDIDPLTLTAEDIVIADIADETYNAEAHTPVVAVTGKGFTLTEGTDFTWEYADNVNASEEAKAIVNILAASPNFTFTGSELKVTKNFTINPLAINKGEGFAPGFKLTNPSGKEYTGAEILCDKPLTWTHGDPEVTTDLVEGTDYEIDYVDKDGNPNNINVGSQYFNIVGKGNFTGTVDHKRRVKIDPRDIAALEITATLDDTAFPYAAAQITPGVTVHDALATVDADLVEGTDYEVVYGDNKNVGTATGTVTVKGLGNYTGEKVVTFDITKAELTIKPTDGQNKNLGTVDPEFTYEITGLVGEDTEDVLSGTPVVERKDVTEAAGKFKLTVKVDGSGNPVDADGNVITAANYDVKVAAEEVFFVIHKVNVDITVANAEKSYGYVLPDLTKKEAFEFTQKGLLGAEEILSLSYALYDEEGNEVTLAAGQPVPFGTYTVKAKEAAATSDSYVFNYIDGTLTVGKKAVTIAINDANKTYGDADPTFTVADFDAQLENGETATALGLTPVLTREEGEAPGTYEITGTLESDNYTFTFTPGTLTIDPVGALALDRVPKADYADALKNTAAKYVNDFDGQTVDVTFSMYATEKGVDEQVFKAEKWYSLVLPFETTVAEVSNAFGYAVVNKFVGRTADDLVKFRLHMQELPANEPFIVKIYQDKKLADVSFAGKTIVKPTQVNEDGNPYVEADDIRFIGSYTGKVDGFRSNEWYFSFSESLNEYYSGNDENTTYMRPLGAYLQTVTSAPVRGLSIQEGDGSIVDYIGGVKAEAGDDNWYSIDGKKMQKPAMKGVYIQNGKKVVVK